MELTQTARTGDFILSLANGTLSLENTILASGANAQAGTVLGTVLAVSVATAIGAVTGNGAITLGAIGPDAQAGTYKLVCVAAASNAGTFNFYAPDGSLIRQITVAGGAAANDHVVVTIADGASDFVAGDSYAITVTAGAYKPLTLNATDGSQTAAAILHAGTNATAADTACVVVARLAEVKADGLIWPDAITDPQKSAAVAQLAARGIHLR